MLTLCLKVLEATVAGVAPKGDTGLDVDVLEVVTTSVLLTFVPIVGEAPEYVISTFRVVSFLFGERSP